MCRSGGSSPAYLLRRISDLERILQRTSDRERIKYIDHDRICETISELERIHQRIDLGMTRTRQTITDLERIHQISDIDRIRDGSVTSVGQVNGLVTFKSCKSFGVHTYPTKRNLKICDSFIARSGKLSQPIPRRVNI